MAVADANDAVAVEQPGEQQQEMRLEDAPGQEEHGEEERTAAENYFFVPLAAGQAVGRTGKQGAQWEACCLPKEEAPRPTPTPFLGAAAEDNYYSCY